VRTARFSPDDRLIVTAAEDGTARLWLAQIGQYFGMLLVHRAAVNRASFGADAHTIVTASDDGSARLWTIPRAQANDAATLADLAEAVSRQTIGNWGELVALPNRDSIIARLRTHSTQQRASTSDLDRMLAELFSAHDAPPQQAAAHPSR
jgi:WD40 repeat protein